MGPTSGEVPAAAIGCGGGSGGEQGSRQDFLLQQPLPRGRRRTTPLFQCVREDRKVLSATQPSIPHLPPPASQQPPVPTQPSTPYLPPPASQQPPVADSAVDIQSSPRRLLPSSRRCRPCRQSHISRRLLPSSRHGADSLPSIPYLPPPASQQPPVPAPPSHPPLPPPASQPPPMPQISAPSVIAATSHSSPRPPSRLLPAAAAACVMEGKLQLGGRAAAESVQG